MRLIVRGPLAFPDFAFVRNVLDDFTDKVKDVVLISDLRIDGEYRWEPSSFPLAERWLRLRWKANARAGKNQTRFSTVITHYAPFSGEKQWTKGLRYKMVKMVRDATHMVVFEDVGNADHETERMVRLAKAFDLKTKIVRV